MKGMHPLLRKWLSIFLVLLLIGVLGGGLAVGALIGYVDSMPPIEVLENYNPPEISRVYDRSGNRQIGEFYTQRRQVVHIKDIPVHVSNAFIAIEDERFYSHFGVDVKGILRSIVENIKAGGKAQGASTITMQVARNVVLENLKKTFTRKIHELFLALQIERNYSKDQILEFYLNTINFGAHAYGIQEASKTYFNKNVKDLSIVEAALLAGLPKAPTKLSPIRNKSGARERRNLVLSNMFRLGFIKTETELKRLQAMPIELNPPPPLKRPAPYFTDYVRNELDLSHGGSEEKDANSKAYQIISTVDLQLQKICEDELSAGLRNVEKEIQKQKPARYEEEAKDYGSPTKGQHRLARITAVNNGTISVSLHGFSAKVPLPEKLPYFDADSVIQKGKLIDIFIDSLKNGKMEAHLYDKAHVQGASVLLNPKTGEIMALVGGDDWNDNANSGQFNRAFMGGRQPGSCWKPLLYAGSFDIEKDGKPEFTPGTVIQDEKFTIGNWTPRNYENTYYGDTALYEALVHSRNVPTIKLFMDIGTNKAIDIYNKFNVVTRPSNWVLDPYPPLALGTPDITPLELAGAYSVFANGGVGITPTPVKRLFSSKSPSDSKVVHPTHYQVISPQAAYITTRILEDVITIGTAKHSIGEWLEEQKKKGRSIPEMAGKTGTTNDCKVAWFSGFTPDLVLIIYVGYDQDRSLGPTMTGGKVVGPIWAATMDKILKTRKDWKMKFDVPPDIEFRDMCSKSGERPTQACLDSGDDVFKNVAFKRGTAPNSDCSYHGGSHRKSPPNSNTEQYFQPQGMSTGQPGWGQAPPAYPSYYYYQQQQRQRQGQQGYYRR